MHTFSVSFKTSPALNFRCMRLPVFSRRTFPTLRLSCDVWSGLLQHVPSTPSLPVFCNCLERGRASVGLRVTAPKKLMLYYYYLLPQISRIMWVSLALKEFSKSEVKDQLTRFDVMPYLLRQWTDFRETFHKYLSRRWEELNRFSRWAVSGQCREQHSCFSQCLYRNVWTVNGIMAKVYTSTVWHRGWLV